MPVEELQAAIEISHPKYEAMGRRKSDEEFLIEDAGLILVAYGIMARIAKSGIDRS